MKIGIDARLYGAKHGGIGRYAQKLIEHLEKIDLPAEALAQAGTENQYFIFLQKNNFSEYQPRNKNFSKVLADFRAYGWREQILFPKLLNKHNLDFVHFTHFNAPIFYHKKFIVTIHDLIISHYPDSRATTLNPFLYKIKLFFYNIVINHAAKGAEKIIAVSEYTKNDIIKFLKVAPEKISVTYEGFDLPKDIDRDCQNIIQHFGINGEYILYVGSAYPHKNLEKLLMAFKKIVEAKNDLKLVLVGKKNYFYERLEQEIKKLNLQNNVILAGYCDDNQLACLYKNAKAYVFPSLIEGFGLPPLEAQSYGVPVASSNAACLPEILGDSVLYFDPKNINDMAEKISQIINDENLRNDLINKGFENLKKYSWENCAKETLDLYML
ncbi:glycosyltransferase family 4 protein [Candidatus Falkowbacteria bacterium]|nr:glycosyltransferase family 4 protein [Candidatus Falkowbacteria bacterium]